MDQLDRFERKVQSIAKVFNDAKASSPFELGYDCGLNGPSNENCHVSAFVSEESTAEWGRGRAAGYLAKEGQNHV